MTNKSKQKKGKKRKTNKKLTNAGVEWGTTAIDTLFGLMGVPVPVASIARNTINVFQRLRDKFLREKGTNFLLASNKLTSDEVNLLLDTIEDKEAFWENLLLTLDRLDDKEKATMIGKLFTALVQGKMKMIDFRKLISIVETTYIIDLKFLFVKYTSGRRKGELPAEYAVPERMFNKQDELLKSLLNTSLITEKIVAKQNPTRAKYLSGDQTEYVPQFELSELGRLFIDRGFYKYSDHIDRD